MGKKIMRKKYNTSHQVQRMLRIKITSKSCSVVVVAEDFFVEVNIILLTEVIRDREGRDKRRESRRSVGD